MLNIPRIGNEAVKVVHIVFVLDVPKDKTKEVARREREREREKEKEKERERKRERKYMKRWRMAYVELLS
jgi:thymidylate kinase